MKRRGKWRRRTFKTLGASELLGGVLDKYRLRGDMRESAMVQSWAAIVGDRVASNAWPARIKDGELVIAVENSSWMHQLSFMKDDLVTKLNKAAGRDMVSTIRFELAGPLRRRGRTSSGVTRRRLTRILKKPPAPAAGEHLREIERDTGAVDDPELRDIIARTRKRWDL